ncbi:MAG TPA: ATP-binding protein, partial [Candidatus Thermoplasmatota archaeon]|nr:ATP-binding protein [Candidatus Thermoplasmatota archaeon]
ATLEEAVNRLLLEQHAPPGIVVDDGGHILHVCGDMSAYIRPSPGKPALQVERMLREEFHADFEAALAETRNSGLPARREMTRLGNEGVRRVSLHMQPLPSCSPAYLAVFTASAEATSESAIEASPADAARLKAEVTTLRHLIATQKGHHAEVVRRLEATIEELRSTQEEFVAANEEFQSANEELETAKEEVQSANEELITVNDQLRSHSEELSSLYADLQNVLASIQVPVVLVDANLRIRRATEGTQRLLNALPSDLGRPITDLRTNLDDNLVIQTIAQCIKTGRPAEEESQDRNGHWYSLRAHPYMTGPRQHNGAVLVIVDIDAEKQAGLRHHKALVLAESVIDTIRDPLVLLDGQLRVTRANGAFHRAFATEASAIVGKQLAETVAGDILESVRLVIEGGPSLVDFEATWNLESGPRNMLVNARRIPPYEDRPDLVVLTATDVTERRRAHAQLEAARRQQLEHLEKLNAFKAEFIASAAHELGNPLTPLKMQLEILGSKADLDPAVEKGIKVIRRSAERLATLVEDMVAVGRFQAGRLELRKAPLDLAQLAEQAIETYKDAAQAAGIKLEAPNLLPTWVHADASHLAQVVNNLVSNAIKYTPQGGLVALGIDAGGGIARLSVADNGIGLSREAKGKLFEPFTRVHDPSLRIPGTGLGLYICKGIVELHGGRLYAESPGEGKGSTFTVELPETPDAALGKATK